jgi:hypothetical protein
MERFYIFCTAVAFMVAVPLLVLVARVCGLFKGTPRTVFPDHEAREELSKLRQQIDDLKRELEEMKQK